MNEVYEVLVKDKLRRYVMTKDNLGDLELRIKALEDKKTNTAVHRGTDPVQGGGSSAEDRLININAEIEILKGNQEDGFFLIDQVEKAMEGLNDMEKDIVLTIYGNPGRGDGKIERLTSKYYYEKSQLYKIAKDSIKQMAFKLYGSY